MSNLKDYISHHSGIVNHFLETEISGLLKSQSEDVLSEPALYSLNAGGKRIRPILCFASSGRSLRSFQIGSRDYDPLERSLLYAGAALESIHTYSLIHDDLPAMDDDDLRRGRPSCHAAFNEWKAILAGDVLNTFAFDLIARAIPTEWDGKRAGQLVRVLSEAAGAVGMVSGQALDIESEKEPRDLSIEEKTSLLKRIHLKKTAAMMKASVELGAMISGIGNTTTHREYGEGLGLLFQITDDILDIESDTETLGKTAGKDEKSGKLTYPALFGLEKSRQIADEMTTSLTDLGRSMELAKGEDPSSRAFLADLPSYIRTRTH